MEEARAKFVRVFAAWQKGLSASDPIIDESASQLSERRDKRVAEKSSAHEAAVAKKRERAVVAEAEAEQLAKTAGVPKRPYERWGIRLFLAADHKQRQKITHVEWTRYRERMQQLEREQLQQEAAARQQEQSERRSVPLVDKEDVVWAVREFLQNYDRGPPRTAARFLRVLTQAAYDFYEARELESRLGADGGQAPGCRKAAVLDDIAKRWKNAPENPAFQARLLNIRVAV